MRPSGVINRWKAISVATDGHLLTSSGNRKADGCRFRDIALDWLRYCWRRDDTEGRCPVRCGRACASSYTSRVYVTECRRLTTLIWFDLRLNHSTVRDAKWPSLTSNNDVVILFALCGMYASNRLVGQWSRRLRRRTDRCWNKKLSYRRGTARRAVSWNLVNCCTAVQNGTFEKAFSIR